MSITPVDGWKRADWSADTQEGDLILPPASHRTSQSGVAHTVENRTSSFAKAFMGCLGVICAIWVVPLLAGFVEGLLTTHAANKHALHLAPNLFAATAIADSRTYSISIIDTNKNNIPTGTELFAQGKWYAAHYGPNDDCTSLLIRGHANVQHGEVDPAYYCRFSILLTEKDANGQDLWPGVGLMCDTTPAEYKAVQHLYHYGEEIQVHGSYAASLDFAIAYLPGGHSGVPVLKDCTFAAPTNAVVRPNVKETQLPPTTDDQPYNY
jgi:hypothetical protein